MTRIQAYFSKISEKLTKSEKWYSRLLEALLGSGLLFLSMGLFLAYFSFVAFFGSQVFFYDRNLTFSGIFVYLLFVVACLAFGVYFKSVLYKDIVAPLLKKYNAWTMFLSDRGNYFFVAIVLSLLLILTGLNFIELTYNGDFPLPIPWTPTEDLAKFGQASNGFQLTNIVCKSIYYRRLVNGDDLECSFNLSYTSEASIFQLEGIVLDEENKKPKVIPPSRRTIQLFDINLPEEDDISSYIVTLKFANSSSPNWDERYTFYRSYFILNGIVSKAEYHEWEQQKFLWTITLIYATFVAVFSVVHNAKELLRKEI